MARLLKVFNKMFNHRQPFSPELAVNCHHNYVALEEHYGEEVFVTRKGAINAAEGCLRHHSRLDGREIVHRQGTRLGREFQLLLSRRWTQDVAWCGQTGLHQDDLARQTSGVECRKDVGVLDEIPGAYKSNRSGDEEPGATW